MKKDKQLIRFDWAMKKLLKDKANFDILEGFLSELLSEDIRIQEVLGERNEWEGDDTSVLVKNQKGESIIVNIHVSKTYEYRIYTLFGVSHAIVQNLLKDKHTQISKVISVTIAYFDIDLEKGYLYCGTEEFNDVYKGDTLYWRYETRWSRYINELYGISPEYHLIRLNQFDDTIQNGLDEWIYFLKNDGVRETFSAKGLAAARQKLEEKNLSYEERDAYKYYLKRLRDIASQQHTKIVDIEFARKRLRNKTHA